MGHKNFSQTRRTIISAFTQWAVVLLILMYFASMAFSATSKEIDVSVEVTLERFNKEIPGAESFIKKAKGVLIFPRSSKPGLALAGNMVKGLCGSEVRPLNITVPWRIQ